MASYMHNPMFGQDDSQDSGYGYDAGSGTSANWESIVAGGLGLATSIINATSGPQPVAAQPIYTGPPVVVPAPGTVTAAGSVSSNMLLIGGLGLAALFLLKKK